MAKQQYGLTIVGNIRVFRKDKEVTGANKKTYNITDVWCNISEKEEDGGYFNQSLNLIFKKGLAAPENNTVIMLMDTFPMITGNGKYRKIALYVGNWVAAE